MIPVFMQRLKQWAHTDFLWIWSKSQLGSSWMWVCFCFFYDHLYFVFGSKNMFGFLGLVWIIIWMLVLNIGVRWKWRMGFYWGWLLLPPTWNSTWKDKWSTTGGKNWNFFNFYFCYMLCFVLLLILIGKLCNLSLSSLTNVNLLFYNFFFLFHYMKILEINAWYLNVSQKENKMRYWICFFSVAGKSVSSS